MEITEIIIKAIITCACVIFTTYIVPYIKTKTNDNRFDILWSYMEAAIRCMEQTDKTNEEKKEFVFNYILDKANELAIGLNEKDIDTLVEGAVNAVKHG